MIHQTELQRYKGSLTELAEELGNLRYDALAKFLSALSEKIQRDGEKDQERNRIQLASSLKNCGKDLASSAENIEQAWKICKKFI